MTTHDVDARKARASALISKIISSANASGVQTGRGCTVRPALEAAIVEAETELLSLISPGQVDVDAALARLVDAARAVVSVVEDHGCDGVLEGPAESLRDAIRALDGVTVRAVKTWTREEAMRKRARWQIDHDNWIHAGCPQSGPVCDKMHAAMVALEDALMCAPKPDDAQELKDAKKNADAWFQERADMKAQRDAALMSASSAIARAEKAEKRVRKLEEEVARLKGLSCAHGINLYACVACRPMAPDMPRVPTLEDFQNAPVGSRAVDSDGHIWVKGAYVWTHVKDNGASVSDDDLARNAEYEGTRILPPEAPAVPLACAKCGETPLDLRASGETMCHECRGGVRTLRVGDVIRTAEEAASLPVGSTAEITAGGATFFLAKDDDSGNDGMHWSNENTGNRHSNTWLICATITRIGPAPRATPHLDAAEALTVKVDDAVIVDVLCHIIAAQRAGEGGK